MNLLRKKLIIAVVCRANITRSAYLRGYMTHLLKTRYPALQDKVLVLSAGIRAELGATASGIVSEIARREGFSLKGHRSYPLDARMVGIADRIITMEEAQKKEIRRHFPEARERIFMLTEYGWEGGSLHIQDIEDPTGQGTREYERFFTLARQEANRILQMLEKELVSGPVDG